MAEITTENNKRRHKACPIFVKRVLDVVIALVGMIVTAVLFLPIAVGIKLSSRGPIFFKQKRTGLHGKEFTCYKFRTMTVNDESDTRQATNDDPRKTRFGEFLRRTSLDELPQVINVIAGDMSIVGPRPHMLSHTDMYKELLAGYMHRHDMKPGITGWAQVNGYRGPTPQLWMMEKRLEYDLWYVDNWSLALDLKILYRTLLIILIGDKNAI